MEKGDSFWMGNPRGATKHLWVVISDKNIHSGTFIIVNFTTKEDYARSECLTLKSEHPGLTESKSWVTFGDAQQINPAQYANLSKLSALNPPGLVMAPKAPLPCIEKLIANAKQSPAFPQVYLKYIS